MLGQKKIRELEKEHGRHKFCYQCGNPNIVPLGAPYFKDYYRCPKCGSSDLDA